MPPVKRINETRLPLHKTRWGGTLRCDGLVEKFQGCVSGLLFSFFFRFVPAVTFDLAHTLTQNVPFLLAINTDKREDTISGVRYVKLQHRRPKVCDENDSE